MTNLNKLTKDKVNLDCITSSRMTLLDINDHMETTLYVKLLETCLTLDFSSLLKNHFECSFVSSECSFQSSNVCFEVRSEYLR